MNVQSVDIGTYNDPNKYKDIIISDAGNGQITNNMK